MNRLARLTISQRFGLAWMSCAGRASEEPRLNRNEVRPAEVFTGRMGSLGLGRTGVADPAQYAAS